MRCRKITGAVATALFVSALAATPAFAAYGDNPDPRGGDDERVCVTIDRGVRVPGGYGGYGDQGGYGGDGEGLKAHDQVVAAAGDAYGLSRWSLDGRGGFKYALYGCAG